MVGILLGTIFVLLFASAPISASLFFGCIALFKFFPQFGNYELVLGQAQVASLDSFSLMAVPFFILMGGLMEKTGIAKKLVNLSEMLTGSKAGGFGNAAIVACMFFASVSGSGPATVAAIGSVMIVPMVQQGYGKAYAGSLVAAGATIGPVIPPSIPMVMYALTMGVSVTKMFVAGFFPGFVMGGSLMIYNYFISRKRGYCGKEIDISKREKIRIIKEAIPAILMPFIVLGGIYGGVFTPTECSVVGVVYSLLVGGLIYKELTWEKFKNSLIEAAITSATVMVIFGSATVLGRLMPITGISTAVTDAMLAASNNPFIIMLMINGILLVIGMFLDTISSILIFAPLLAPIAISLGYDNVWFGVMMTVNLCIGMITPPMAANYYIGMKIAGSNFEDMFKEIMGLLAVLVFALLLMIIFPQIITFLPKILGL